MRRPRRNHSAKFKSKVGLAALKGDETIVELLVQFDVHANQITEWKNQLLPKAEQVFLLRQHVRDLLSRTVSSPSSWGLGQQPYSRCKWLNFFFG